MGSQNYYFFWFIYSMGLQELARELMIFSGPGQDFYWVLC
ncbi:hypothetical protein DSUL_100218 [Desulfovibrionales bacterium]